VKPSTRTWLVVAALAPGVILAMLDATVMSIAIPSMVWDLNTTITQVTWVLNAYTLGLVALFLTMGRVADRFGHKRVYIGGLIVFAVCSFGCARAPTVGWLVAFRVGQAVGAAAIVPVSLVLLLNAFPRTQWGFATGFAAGLYGALTQLAAALGPTVGGYLTQYHSWRWIFLLNLPLAAVAVAAALLLVRSDEKKATKTPIDLAGMGLSAAAMFCLTLAIIQGNDWGWTSAGVLGLFAAAAAAAAAFVAWELRVAAPMLDLRLFRIRPFAAANAAVMTIDVAFMGTAFLLVIYMVGILRFQEVKAAIAVTPMPLAGLLLAPFAGRLVDRIGPRIVVVAGALASTAGLLLLADLQIGASVADIAWRTALVGAGVGLSLPALMAAGMSALPRAVQGVGSGALNTARLFGFALGVAILVAVFTHTVGVQMVKANAASRGAVAANPLIPGDYKDAFMQSLDAAAKVDVSHGIEAIRMLSDPTAGVALPPSGSLGSALLDVVSTEIKLIYRGMMGAAFVWPFRVAAIAALLAVPPGLLLGRRLKTEEDGPEEDGEPAG
jgi:EmrB/QacA subfamily drug resistance transporter